MFHMYTVDTPMALVGLDTLIANNYIPNAALITILTLLPNYCLSLETTRLWKSKKS